MNLQFTTEQLRCLLSGFAPCSIGETVWTGTMLLWKQIPVCFLRHLHFPGQLQPTMPAVIGDLHAQEKHVCEFDLADWLLGKSMRSKRRSGLRRKSNYLTLIRPKDNANKPQLRSLTENSVVGKKANFHSAPASSSFNYAQNKPK